MKPVRLPCQAQRLGALLRCPMGIGAAILLLPHTAALAGGTVSVPSEAALRAAMAGGGVVNFACEGVISLSATLTNSSDTMLTASGHSITLSGADKVRIFFVPTNVSLTLVNLTLANGASPGGSAIYNGGGQLTLLGASLVNNGATGSYSPAFSGDGYGGAILNAGGTVNATNCLFQNNVVRQTQPSSDATLLGGGALANLNGTLRLGDCRFVGNSVAALTNIQSAGTRSCLGGAIYNAGLLSATRCSLLQNTLTGGRGVAGPSTGYTPGGAGGAGGDGKGGGVFNAGEMTLSSSLLASNIATGGDGGAGGAGGAIQGGPTYNGGAGGAGGLSAGSGLYNAGTARLVNCTLTSGISSAGTGGTGGPGGYNPSPAPHWGQPGPSGPGGNAAGLICTTNGNLFVTNCTIAFGAAQAAAGGFAWCGGIRSAGGVLVNALLASNTPVNFSGAITDAGHNLSTDESLAFTDPTSLIAADPMLGTLGDYGGPTLTLALLPFSPAIDAGDTGRAPSTDQRGLPRPLGSASDIGAFEYGVPSLSISPSSEGGFNISVTGAAPPSCCLWWSTNLMDWIPVATNVIGAYGAAVFYQDAGPGQTSGFYRVGLP